MTSEAIDAAKIEAEQIKSVIYSFIILVHFYFQYYSIKYSQFRWF
jgi:hypothetical protein